MHPLGTTGNPTWFLLYLSTEMVISLFHPEIWVMTIATYKIQVRLSFFHVNCWVWCDQCLLRECKTLCFYNVIPKLFKLGKCITILNSSLIYYSMDQVARIFKFLSFLLNIEHFAYGNHGKSTKIKIRKKMGVRRDTINWLLCDLGKFDFSSLNLSFLTLSIRNRIPQRDIW